MSSKKSLKLYEKDQTTGIPCSAHCKYGFSYKVITRIGFSIHCFESFYDSLRKNNFDLIGDIQSPSFKFQSIAAILYNIHYIYTIYYTVEKNYKAARRMYMNRLIKKCKILVAADVVRFQKLPNGPPKKNLR